MGRIVLVESEVSGDVSAAQAKLTAAGVDSWIETEDREEQGWDALDNPCSEWHTTYRLVISSSDDGRARDALNRL
jgi:hypothetical protein